jgi:hypothetical protein
MQYEPIHVVRPGQFYSATAQTSGSHALQPCIRGLA